MQSSGIRPQTETQVLDELCAGEELFSLYHKSQLCPPRGPTVYETLSGSAGGEEDRTRDGKCLVPPCASPSFPRDGVTRRPALGPGHSSPVNGGHLHFPCRHLY